MAGDVGEGTIATQAVSYADMDSCTLSNIFLILSLVSSTTYTEVVNT